MKTGKTGIGKTIPVFLFRLIRIMVKISYTAKVKAKQLSDQGLRGGMVASFPSGYLYPFLYPFPSEIIETGLNSE
jgi:hypothetical protein